MKKYIFSLIIGFVLLLPVASFAQETGSPPPEAVENTVEAQNDMMPTGTMMDAKTDMPYASKDGSYKKGGSCDGKWGMMGHHGKYWGGHMGWKIGFMALHIVLWLLFLGLSAYVVRMGWDRAGNRKKK